MRHRRDVIDIGHPSSVFAEPTTTQRLGCDDLRQVIANFEELRSYFASSPYSKFFDQT